ncbi:MAG: hypothetical protein R2697_10080 [Ilumatobacteraceae bacterium]
MVQGIYAQLATLSVAILAFAGADVAGANGFIAAFTAGIAFGAATGSELAERFDEYTEDTGRLLAIGALRVRQPVRRRSRQEHDRRRRRQRVPRA